jgi:endonuclease/exonuclease/phosphatase family metal-dependent hydrolase
MGLALATFNVENLLEPRSDADRALVAGKIDSIARMLRACDADVVGLQEIGPPDLLKAVVERAGAGYRESVIGTADARGIRCALISRLPLVQSQVHTAEALSFPVFRDGDPPPFGDRIPLRRGVVHARVQAAGLGPVDVLVAHFKSSRRVARRDASGNDVPATTARARAEGTLLSLVWRSAEALYVRGLLDDLMAGAGGARIAVVGDLNDVPDSVPVRLVRGDGPAELLDCTTGIPAASRFSAFHDGGPLQIDHVLASAALHARLLEARFLNGDLRPRSPISLDGREAPSVDSDHAPLLVSFG